MIRPTQLAQLVIHERATELIPFLRSLTEDEKLTLIPYLQTLNQEYLGYGGREATRSRRATEAQRRMLGVASLVCLDRDSFASLNVHYQVLNERVLNRVLPWYCPGWFSDYVNHYATDHYLPTCFSYDYLLRMMQRGWVRPTEAVVTQFLPQLIYQLRDHQWVYCPENLTRHDITVREHLWYLFRYETNVNWSDHCLRYGEWAQDETDWKFTLRLLAEGGKIDRLRLLQETVAAASRPFNQSLHQWFLELLRYLKPTPEELLAAAVQPAPAVAPAGLRSLGEVCQELFVPPSDTPKEATPVVWRTLHSLPSPTPASRAPLPYPREVNTPIS